MDTPQKPSHKKTYIVTAIIIVLVAAVIIGGYFWNKRRKDASTSTTTGNNNYLTPQSQPINPSPIPETPTPPVSMGQPVSNESSDDEHGLLAEPALKSFIDRDLGFSVAMPADWTVQQTTDEMQIIAPDKRRFSIQVYHIGPGDNRSLRSFLAAQPNMHNISETRFREYPAVAFTVSGIYRHGYALLDNGKLYYLLGKDIENTEIASSFKFYGPNHAANY